MGLISKRVRLRRFNEYDLPLLQRLESDPDVVRHTRIRKPLSIEQSKQRLDVLLKKETPNSPLGIWAAEFNQTQDFIGWFMLIPNQDNTVELGYMILKELWGQGFATEVGQLLIKAAFAELKIESIRAVSDVKNHSSIRVLEKLGFKLKTKQDTECSLFYELNRDYQQ